MCYEVKEYLKFKEHEVLNLYRSVGWTNYTDKPDMLRNAFEHSLAILAAYDGETLTGLIRVVGDGYSIIYIQDIIVLPEYQRRGIGTLLLKTVLTKYREVYQKVLMTDNTEKTISFYKSVGFVMDTDMECRAFLKMY